MDPKKLFADERNSAFCVYCGSNPETRDHVPSKVLLDEPFPGNLPVVPACEKCNNFFSRDEPYLACFIECVIRGSVDPLKMQREKIRRILSEKLSIASLIAACCEENSVGELVWYPDIDRFRNIVLKLAQGHVAYELSEPQLDEPEVLNFVPIHTLTPEQLLKFETPPKESLFPEFGSRAFLRLFTDSQGVFADDLGWQIIQPDRYRYLVFYSQRIGVRIVISEYLACEVLW